MNTEKLDVVFGPEWKDACHIGDGVSLAFNIAQRENCPDEGYHLTISTCDYTNTGSYNKTVIWNVSPKDISKMIDALNELNYEFKKVVDK